MRLVTLVFISFFSLVSSVFACEELIIEPDQGRAPLISAIQNAKTSVDLVMYGFTDNEMLNALIKAKDAGKNVRILLEPHPYKSEDENEYIIKRLQAARINLTWPNSKFQLTHQKTFIIDDKYALVLTFNLTRSSFKNERNFGLKIDNADMVREISTVFLADLHHDNTSVKNPNLIWSPDNSREKIDAFINSAQDEIKVYAQDLSDYQTIGTLAKAARKGKSVQIIMSNPSFKTNRKLDYLRKAGVKIHFSKDYIIHAKVIIVDHKLAMLGSVNLTNPSIRDNRELAVITHEPKVIDELLKTFKHDWD